MTEVIGIGLSGIILALLFIASRQTGYQVHRIIPIGLCVCAVFHVLLLWIGMVINA